MVSSPGFSRNLRNNDPEDADIAAQPRFVSGATRSASWRWLMETSRGEFGDRKKKRKEDSSKGIGSIDITQLCVYTDIYTHIIYICKDMVLHLGNSWRQMQRHGLAHEGPRIIKPIGFIGLVYLPWNYPPPRIPVTTRIMNHFLVGNPNLNLHL